MAIKEKRIIMKKPGTAVLLFSLIIAEIKKNVEIEMQNQLIWRPFLLFTLIIKSSKKN